MSSVAKCLIRGAALPGVAIDLITGATEITAVPAGPAELTFRLINFTVVRRNVTVAAARSASVDAVLMLSLSADVIVTECLPSATTCFTPTC